MWLLVARDPEPDMPAWPGRHALAAVDAVSWPLLWIWISSRVPAPVGIVGPFFVAVAALCLLSRLRRALWENRRYRFTTWRWGKMLAAIFVIGAVLKIASIA